MKQILPIVVVGGGHAGIEAALAATRVGVPVIMVTMDAAAIGRMSCNPAIGGLAKGHLVAEIDALGGVMGRASDYSGIQFKMLNKSKGRAVWSPRCQVDKKMYPLYIQNIISDNPNIQIVEDEVVDFCVENYSISSVILRKNSPIKVGALIVATGTFLNGLVHVGNKSFPAGRLGEKPSLGLAHNIVNKGFKTARLKTGTPPRLLSTSIDWKQTLKAGGDDNPHPFSSFTKLPFNPPNIPCNIVNTNPDVHNLLNNNLKQSPMFSGKISGIGPRYCPSIEDKIVRFSNRDHHQLFLEPEWRDSQQIYLNGFSTSMPADIQRQALRKIPALSNVQLIRPGYAIEYDFFPTHQLKATLESKEIRGLYFAGQLNGTSGYEEAAAQGLIAGANAGLKLLNAKPLLLDRSTAYIGVLIDDLVTKDIDEPYRMFTSSAEHRLFLRFDNAHIRLSKKAYDARLISKKTFNHFIKFQSEVNTIKDLCSSSNIVVDDKSITFSDYIKRPQNFIDEGFISKLNLNKFSNAALFTAETDIKYDGYVKIERERIKKLEKLDSVPLPRKFNYTLIRGLSSESREKLTRMQPETLGQASRLFGVRPSDISVLAIFLQKNN